MDWDFKDDPSSPYTVTLRLAQIQKQCSNLLSEPDSLDELQLEGDDKEPEEEGGFNPYNHT